MVWMENFRSGSEDCFSSVDLKTSTQEMYALQRNQTCCSRKRIYLLHMLQSFYYMIEVQKIYYSDPFSRAFD